MTNLLRNIISPIMKPQKRAAPKTPSDWAMEAAAAEEVGDWARVVVCYRRALELAPFCTQTRDAFEWAIEQQIEVNMKRRPRHSSAPASHPQGEKKHAFGDFQRDESEDLAEPAPRPTKPAAKVLKPGQRKSSGSPTRRYLLPASVFVSVLITTTGLLMAATTSNFLRGVLFSEKLPTIETVKLPDALAARLADAANLLERGEPKRAVDRLQEASREFPEHQVLLNPELARALRAFGLSENREQRYQTGAEAFREAAKAEPQNVLNWIDLGRSLRESARSSAIAKDPEKQRQVLSDAEAAFIRAQVLSPRDGAVLFGLAQVYSAMNRRSEAVVAYERVVAEAPSSRERQMAEEAVKELRKQ